MSLEDDLLPPPRPLKVRASVPLTVARTMFVQSQNEIRDYMKRSDTSDDDREKCGRALAFLARAVGELEDLG